MVAEIAALKSQLQNASEQSKVWWHKKSKKKILRLVNKKKILIWF